MRRRREYALALAACLTGGMAAGCAFDNEVGQRGDYAFTSVDVTDTAALPLGHLLFVEEDSTLGHTLVYVFSGELGAGDIGLTDLRRIASLHGRARMQFERERERYVEYAQDDLESNGKPLELELDDGRKVELARLEQDALFPSGASRVLRSVESEDYTVRAYFGVFEHEGARPEGTIAIEGVELRMTPALGDAEIEVRLDDDALAVDYGDTPGADYLVLDPHQVITEVAEDTPAEDEDDGEPEPPARLEAIVRTTLAPGVEYRATSELLSSSFGQGCWSTDEPLVMRLMQVSRDYHRDGAGDWALIAHKLDAVEVEKELWTGLIEDAVASEYCDDYE